MPAQRISIIFCGGCNPRIERRLLAEAVWAELEQLGFCMSYNQQAADYLIFLSGCRANCAQRSSKSSAPCLAIAANTMEREEIAVSEMVNQIIAKVRDYFG